MRSPITDDVFHGGEPLPDCVRISAHAPVGDGLYPFIPNVAPSSSPRDRDAPAGETPSHAPISPAGKFSRGRT